MSARVSVRMSEADGPAIAVKVATDPQETDRLWDEADLLRSHPHPGVVPFVDYRVTDTGAELHTRFVGPPLDRWHGTTEEIAGLVAALASTLEDLHHRETAHGRINRSHVLVADDGRPVLCGFGGASDDHTDAARDVQDLGRLLTDLLATNPTPRRRLRQLLEPAVHRRRLELVAAQATADAPERRPTARAVARRIIDAVPDARLPAPECRPDGGGTGISAPGAGTTGDPVFAAAFVDLRNTDENAIFTDRPWADSSLPQTPEEPSSTDDVAPQNLDAAVSHSGETPEPVDHSQDEADLTVTVGGQALRLTSASPWSSEQRSGARPGGGPRRGIPGGQRPKGRHHRSHRGRRHLAGAALVLAAATGIAGGVVAATVGSGGSGSGDIAEAAACPTDDGHPGTPPADVVATYQVDVTGNGCPDTVAVTAGGVVETVEGRWAVGEPDDIVVLGDWSCDGLATPAVLRPSSGAVFVFPDWAETGDPLRIEPAATMPEGRALLAEPARTSDATCDVPVVEMADGSHHTVEIQP